MKLYTKNQVIFFSVCTLVLGVFFAFVLSKFFFAEKKSVETNASVSFENSVENPVSDENILKITSENSESDSVISSNSKNEGYTQEEIQNINVYNLCNEAVVNINTQVVGVNWFLEPVVEDGGSGSGSINVTPYILLNFLTISLHCSIKGS